MPVTLNDLGITKFSIIPRQYVQEDRDLRNLAANTYAEQDNYYKTPFPIRKDLELESLVKIKEHAWMKDVEFVLLDKRDYESEQEALNELLTYIREDCVPVGTELAHKGRTTVAVDFESFGLNQLYARLGGNRINMNPVANVPLSVRTKDGEEIGFVIPVNHTEVDGVPNFTLDSIKSFLKTLSDEFFLIFHNSLFDREIMQQNRHIVTGKQIGRARV